MLAESLRQLKGPRRMKGSGNQIEIPMMLKMRWTRAIWIAFFFCVTIEARKAVQVVPICAPSVRGSMSSTVMIWSATRAPARRS